MSALAKVAETADPYPFELTLGSRGEWIVRGPQDKCGGIFVSQDAAETFIRREGRMLRQEAERRSTALALPTLRLVGSRSEPHSTPQGREAPPRLEAVSWRAS